MLRFKKVSTTSSSTIPAAPSDSGMEHAVPRSGTVGVERPVESSDQSGEETTKISLVGGIGGTKVSTVRRINKRSAGELRVQKGQLLCHYIPSCCCLPRLMNLPTHFTDIAELDAGTIAEVKFPDPNNLTQFEVDVKPDSGYWAGARYTFSFKIPDSYPHEPPKVVCIQKIFHPNIDYHTGKVCINILGAEWKPVLDINAVIYGVIFLFYEPNSDDPSNKEAGALFRGDKTEVFIDFYVIIS